MSSALSFSRALLLAASLVGAWIPAAVIASPGSEPTASVPEAPSELHPVADESAHAPVQVALLTS